METKPWYMSKTIWASVVATLAAGLSLMGHTIDPGTQVVLVNDLTSVADLIATLAAIAAAISRAKATTTLTKGPTP